AWGVEISTETNPWDAGLGFAVAMKKDSFIGKVALMKSKEDVTRKLGAILFDDIRQVPLGNEPVRVGGQIVGRIKSGGQGYTLGKAIGYAYLPIAHSEAGTILDVEFFGQWRQGVIAMEPLFDPTNAKIRA
ncbi:MAG: hypothetical protein F2719_07880, partial [Actinobacteria bacterium]|nr:hypothetical protein [Actinomycetota bacterium]